MGIDCLRYTPSRNRSTSLTTQSFNFLGSKKSRRTKSRPGTHHSWRLICWGKSGRVSYLAHGFRGRVVLNSEKAAALALRARDEGVTGIIGQVLNIPATCHPDLFPKEKFAYTSFEENRDAPILNAERTRWFWSRYQSQKAGIVSHS
jgi:hypothetical protein